MNLKIIMKCIEKITEKFSTWGLDIASVLIFMMSLLITAEVICRSFLNFSLLVADEFSGYFCVGVACLGVASSLRSKSFVKIDILYDRMSKKWKNISFLIVRLISFIYVAIVLNSAWGFVMTSYKYKMTSMFMTKTPLIYPQFLIIIGLVFLIFQIVVDIKEGIENIRLRD